MSKPLLKKQIAAQVGISPRTMRQNPKHWSWLERCRVRICRRPVYDPAKVAAGLRERGIS